MTDVLGTAKAIVRIARRGSKPVLCCFMGIIDVSSGVKYLQEHGIPVFLFPENAAKAFGALYRYARWLNRQHLAQFSLEHDTERAKKIIKDSLAAGKTHLGELEGNGLLECYGFSVLPTQLAKTGDEAAAMAENMGFPVVLKIVSENILHKSDAGGVALDLKTQEEVKKAFEKIISSAAAYDPAAEIEGVLVQKMAPRGHEVILGLNLYPVFGPLLMFGMGGILVEIFQDVVFRLAPVGRNDARRMVRQIKGYRLLQGFRGMPKADVETVERSLVSLSDMALNHPEIKELDINPLLVHAKGGGATAADCRIILKKPEPEKHSSQS
jgi:acetyltransferase